MKADGLDDGYKICTEWARFINILQLFYNDGKKQQ